MIILQIIILHYNNNRKASKIFALSSGWNWYIWIFTKKCTAKLYSFLVNDTSFASDNPLCFRNEILERI